MGKIATREAYGNTLAKLALENKDIVVVDADLAGSTMTKKFKEVAPERHFDMGIAESNMITVSAGLAANGKIPYCSTFAVFASGRVYDQIRASVAYTNLPVKICATHAGITVGEDGATHQALEDLSLMRAMPNMTVIQPCDGAETQAVIEAIAKYNKPVYVRLGRSAVDDVYQPGQCKFEIGKGVVIHEGEKDVLMIATGLMVQQSQNAIETLKQNGINPTLINIHTIKPLDEELIVKYAKDCKVVVTLEEHSIIGGLGSAVSETLAKNCPRKQIFIGTNDTFGESGKPAQLMEKYGLSSEKIVERILKEVK